MEIWFCLTCGKNKDFFPTIKVTWNENIVHNIKKNIYPFSIKGCQYVCTLTLYWGCQPLWWNMSTISIMSWNHWKLYSYWPTFAWCSWSNLALAIVICTQQCHLRSQKLALLCPDLVSFLGTHKLTLQRLTFAIILYIYQPGACHWMYTKATFPCKILCYGQSLYFTNFESYVVAIICR